MSKDKKSAWESWSKEDLRKEIRCRMIYFYAKTDGTLEFPNNKEGDLLKMVQVLLSKENK